MQFKIILLLHQQNKKRKKRHLFYLDQRIVIFLIEIKHIWQQHKNYHHRKHTSN